MDTPTFHELKREALIRRSDKLLAWLGRQEYSVYAGEESTQKLIALVDLIVWALEKSLLPYNWRHYKLKFTEARNTVADIVATGKEQERNFYTALSTIKGTLKDYRAFIERRDLSVAQHDGW